MSDLISRKLLLNKINAYVVGSQDKEFICKLIKEMPSTENKGEWIPCSERLPEQFKEVIVTDIETSDTYLSRYVGNGYWECDNGTFNNRIIAWMPLPEPYKADREVNK